MRRRLALLLAFVLVVLVLLALRPRPAPPPPRPAAGAPSPEVAQPLDTAARPEPVEGAGEPAVPLEPRVDEPVYEGSPDGGTSVLVRCSVVLGEEVPRGGDVWEFLPEGLFHSGDVEVSGDEVRFHAMQPSGRASVRLEGYGVFPVTWEQTGPHAARCVGEPPSPPFLSAEVVGVVRDLRPDEIEETHVSRCDGGTVSVDPQGGFDFRTEPGPCRLQAMRRHGQLTAYGAPLEVEVEVWDVVEVELEPPPPWTPAGMGIAYEVGEDGVRVLRVIEGSPAERAGLHRGDLIVALDGISMAGVGVEEFLDYGLGPEGSEVTLTLRSGDTERTIRFFREALPAPPRPESRPRPP